MEIDMDNIFTSEEIANMMEESAKKYEVECEEYWNNLSYEEQLKAFYSVVKRIYKGDVIDQGSYRHVLYEVFGFKPDAYIIGMECNYLELHNHICTDKR
jgi:hypothetical protein